MTFLNNHLRFLSNRGGDGPEFGGPTEDDGLLNLDHPSLPLLLVSLASEYVYMNVNVHTVYVTYRGWQR